MKIKINTQEEIDSKLEIKWRELEDVPFDEESNGELILSGSWYLFPKGITRTEIWHWFDQRHSKGVAWLLYEFDYEEHQRRIMCLEKVIEILEKISGGDGNDK